MPKQRKATHQPFEGDNPHGNFVKITTDMLNSNAWKSLSMSAWGLYLHFKSHYRQKSMHGAVESSNVDDIAFPVSEWKPLYRGNQRAFVRDRKELIEHGFIRVVVDNRHVRKATIYGLDDAWKAWKPPGK